MKKETSLDVFFKYNSKLLSIFALRSISIIVHKKEMNYYIKDENDFNNQLIMVMISFKDHDIHVIITLKQAKNRDNE